MLSAPSKKLELTQSIQHRSRLSIKELIVKTKQVQNELQTIFEIMELTTNPLHVDSLLTQAIELMSWAQKLIVTLQVMGQLDIELTSARAALRAVVRSGGTHIQDVRNRVIWLENKIIHLGRQQLLPEKKYQGLQTDILFSNQSQFSSPKETTKSDSDILNMEPCASNILNMEPCDSNILNMEPCDSNILNMEPCDYNILNMEQPVSDSILAEADFVGSPIKCDEAEKTTEEGDHSDLFITEVKVDDVWTQTGKPLLEESDKLQDFSDANSPKQRMESSELSHLLGEINPASYNRLSLVVPTLLVQKDYVGDQYCELPWRVRRKESDIKDIQRIALDRLAHRVYDLYDQIYQAAILSDSLTSQNDKPASDHHNRSIPSPGEPITKRIISKNQNEGNHHANTEKARLAFQTKPIPAPVILPTAKINRKKEYPVLPSVFCQVSHDIDRPARQVVHQSNLLQETRLVLYRGKVKAKVIDRNLPQEEDVRLHKNESSKSSARSRLTLRADSSGLESEQRKDWQPGSLQLARIQTLIDFQVKSPRLEDRIDAVRQLGFLPADNNRATSALIGRLTFDQQERVKYEATKSLLRLGSWRSKVVESLGRYLETGSLDMQLDLMTILIQGRNISSLDRTTAAFLKLTQILSNSCSSSSHNPVLALNAALCLSRLGVQNDQAQARLLATIQTSSDTRLTYQALEVLVKNLEYLDQDVISHILSLLQHSPVWKCRFLACELLKSASCKYRILVEEKEHIYSVLEHCLWEDPSPDVKFAAADTLNILGMLERAKANVFRNLKSSDEAARAEAASAAGYLGLKHEKFLSLFMEMLKLDTSEYVRIMIIRTLGVMKVTDPRVLRCLKDKQKQGGALGSEAARTLHLIGQALTTTQASGPLLYRSMPR